MREFLFNLALAVTFVATLSSFVSVLSKRCKVVFSLLFLGLLFFAIKSAETDPGAMWLMSVALLMVDALFFYFAFTFLRQTKTSRYHEPGISMTQIGSRGSTQVVTGGEEGSVMHTDGVILKQSGDKIVLVKGDLSGKYIPPQTLGGIRFLVRNGEIVYL